MSALPVEWECLEDRVCVSFLSEAPGSERDLACSGMEGQMGRWLDEWKDGRTDRRKADGWRDVWTAGWRGGWVNRGADVRINDQIGHFCSGTLDFQGRLLAVHPQLSFTRVQKSLCLQRRAAASELACPLPSQRWLSR